MNLHKDTEEQFERILGFWFPPNLDALTLDGDSRSMKERLKSFLAEKLAEAYEKGRQSMYEEVYTKDMLAEAEQRGAKKEREEMVRMIEQKRLEPDVFYDESTASLVLSKLREAIASRPLEASPCCGGFKGNPYSSINSCCLGECPCHALEASTNET